LSGPGSAAPHQAPGEWVLLAYRVPREPSSPRIAIWRKLKRLGVAQVGDGLVALPADARTREHLDWLAEEVVEAGGSATMWLARPATVAAERELAAGMTAARVAEYGKVLAEAAAGAELEPLARAALLRRLRAELRRIARRDYFPPPQRGEAQAAVAALASHARAESQEPP
jgi:hypothetical protein